MQHNLDVDAYSLGDLLSLFEISSFTPSLEEMRRAKKKMLMTHPDQSRLPSAYYLFYRQAYEVVLTFYQEQTRQNQATTVVGDYAPPNVNHGVQGALDKMSARDFHSKFNQLFEKMDMAAKPDPARNAWFTHTAPVIDNVPDRIAPKDMAQAFQTVKKAQTAALVSHRGGVQEMQVSQGAASFYDDDDDAYISSDVFSKLKFDDLRKVHKDQTVLAVGEQDYVYRSLEHYSRERDAAPTAPMPEDEAKRLLQDQVRLQREQIMQRQYLAMQKEKENEKKNQAVLSQFLLLTNSINRL
jgi:hypothetical protein